MAHDRSNFIWRDGEADVAQNPFHGVVIDPFTALHLCARGVVETLIRKPDVAEFNAAAAIARARSCRRDYLRRCVEQFKNALAGGHGGLQNIVFFAEILNGPEESLRVLNERDQHTQCDRTANGGSKAGSDGMQQHAAPSKPDHRSDSRCAE